MAWNLDDDPRIREQEDTMLKPLVDGLVGEPLRAPGIQAGPDLVAPRMVKQELRLKSGLQGRTDLYLLHTGIIYEWLGITRDVVEQFRLETKSTAHRENFVFKAPVIGGLDTWASAVQAIELVYGEQLNLWLLNLLFVRRKQRVWWRLRRQTIQVPDPFRVDAGGILRPDQLINLSVYLPYGSRGMCRLRSGVNNIPTVWFDPKAKPAAGTTPEDKALYT